MASSARRFVLTLLLWLWACAAPSAEKDADGDGFTADDCDDADAAVHPGAEEACNGLDDNCDGAADEGLETLWYADADADGAGDGTASTAACAAPEGYVAVAGDCDDLDPAVREGADEQCDGVDNNCDGAVDEAGASGEVAVYLDQDGDGWGDTASARFACAPGAGEVTEPGDCQDDDPAIRPDAAERCDPDDVDEDCDGEAEEAGALESEELYVDADEDGYGAGAVVDVCDPGHGYAANDADCDDTAADVHPGATEICDADATDEDCDGEADEAGAAGSTPWFVDADGDGFGAGSTIYLCGATSGYSSSDADCDDTRADVSPRESERCDDAGVDEDCDGAANDDGAVDRPTWFYDADEDGYGGSVSVRSCAEPDGYVGAGGDCNDSRADVSPAGTERCDGDDVDEDCNGVADDASAEEQRSFYVDGDGDGYGGGSTTTACDLGAGLATTSTDCDDSRADVSPAATEVCDGLDVDEDCDGTAEEAGAVGGSTWFLDADGDGYGGALTTVACDAGGGRTGRGGDCDDGRADVSPAAEERCDADGADEDCDGFVDDADVATGGATLFVDTDGDGFGAGISRVGCDAVDGESPFDGDCDDTRGDVSPDGWEACDDAAVDEDCDTLVDDQDPDVDRAGAPTRYPDADGDGFGDPEAGAARCDAADGWVDDASDCDDAAVSVSPAGVEDCGSVADDDCDGAVNERDALACVDVWPDLDHDGYGAGSAACWCATPAGYADNGADCSDTDASSFPTAWHPDGDGDGYGDEATSTEACAAPPGWLADDADCDDADAAVNPLASERYGDTVDEDCDGATWPTDVCPAGATRVPSAYGTIQAALSAGRTVICVEGEVQAAPSRVSSASVSSASSISIYGQGTEFSTILGSLVIDNDAASLTVSNLTLNGGVVATGGDVTLTGLRIIADAYTATTGVAATTKGGSFPYVYVEKTEITGWAYGVVASADDGGGEADIVLINNWVHDNTYAGRSNASPSSGAPYTWIGSYQNTYVDNGRGLYTAHSGSGYAELTSYDDIWTGTALCALSRSSSSTSSESVSAGTSIYWDNGYNMCAGVTLSSPVLDDPELDTAFSPPVPSATSPAVDAGEWVWSDGRDFWGALRATRPDFGAVEVR